MGIRLETVLPNRRFLIRLAVYRFSAAFLAVIAFSIQLSRPAVSQLPPLVQGRAPVVDGGQMIALLVQQVPVIGDAKLPHVGCHGRFGLLGQGGGGVGGAAGVKMIIGEIHGAFHFLDRLYAVLHSVWDSIPQKGELVQEKSGRRGAAGKRAGGAADRRA